MAKDLITRTEVPIYGPPLSITLIIVPCIEDIGNALCPEEPTGKECAFTHLDWPICHIVIRSGELDHNCIAHEADHACHKILREVGMTESGDSEEAYSYFNAWIADWIYRELDKAKIKVKHRK